ncbi:MAG: fused MFS/spermidine synthase [Limisphaerales bacterium]
MENTGGNTAKGRSAVYPTAVLCMLLSGVAGLVYQVVWTRYLALMTGHTSYAIVAVLAAFMGGLALGNLLLGRIADKIQRPLAFYGWLEIAIALYALAFPKIFQLGYGVYISAASSGTNLFLKFCIAMGILLLPTVLMGGTLPILARMVTKSLGELRDRVGMLYFINSLGAVFGVGLAEFWLIPDLGLEMTVMYGAVLNLVAGALALFVSGYVKEENQDTEEENTDDSPKPAPVQGPMETFSAKEIRLAVIGIGLSGFVAMLYEVAWTRMLGLIMGTTSGAFAIMLITFILGIALGSFLIGRMKCKCSSLSLFAWLEVLIGASIVVMMFFYSRLPYWFTLLSNAIDRDVANYVYFQWLQGIFCFAVMIIPTTFLGMTLPLVSRISTAELARTGRSVGFVFSFNTIGAVLGAIVTGLWLMPEFGLARTFALGTGINIAVGVFILAQKTSPARQKLAPMVLPGVVVWMLLAGWLFHNDWATVTTAGAFRYRHDPAASYAEFKEMNDQQELLYHRDGAGSTVTVKEYPKNHRFLQVNGKADASNGTDMLTQLMLGHVPALLHPNPEMALVIGLGSGVTCGAVMTHPSIKEVDVVEISPEVLEASRYFETENDKALDNEKLTVHIDDAKSFLQTSDGIYDIIISEPSNPWMAGVPGLYSVEFYSQCVKKLRPSGLMCQWLHVYEISPESVNTIIATFTGNFQYTSVWLGSAGDLLLIGSTLPQETELEKVLQRMNEPAVSSSLKRGDIDSKIPVTLFAHQLTSEDYTLFAYPEDTLVHRDMFPVLETMAQKGMFAGKETLHIFAFDERKTARPNSLLAQYQAKYPLESKDWAALFAHNEYETVFDNRLVRSIGEAWSLKHPNDPAPTMTSALFKDERRPTASDIAVMSFKLADIVGNPDFGVIWTIEYARAAMANYRYLRTVFNTPKGETLASIMEKLAQNFPNEAHIYNAYLAELAWDTGDQNRFIRMASDLFIRQGAQMSADSFPLNDPAPATVLVRLIEYFLENPDPEKLGIVVEVAKKSGLNSPTHPRLQAAVIRATVVVGPSPGMAGQGQPNAPQQQPKSSPFNTPQFKNPGQKQ